MNFIYLVQFIVKFLNALKVREAAKKVLFLVAGPLRGGGGLNGCAFVAGPLRKELFFVASLIL